MSQCKELANLGAAACKNPMQIAKRHIFVPELGSDGTANGFDTTAEITKAALQSLFDAVNPLDRFYPTPLLENVENVRAETVFHEFNSGTKIPIKEGIKHFIGYIPLEQPLLLEGLKAWEGQDFGIYVIDKDGNFIYQTDAATKLKVNSFQVDGNSFLATYMEPTDAEVPMVKIEFDYSISTRDELMRYIPAADLDFNGLGLDVYALHTINGTVEAGTGLEVIATLKTEYDTPVEGLTTSEVSAKDDEGSAVTVETVTESSAIPGEYTVVLSGITGTASVALHIVGVSRKDFSAINAKYVTVTSS